MKKIYTYILLIIATVTLAPSCTSYFNDMNTNPNSPTPSSVDPKYELLYGMSRSILYSFSWQTGDEETVCHFAEYAANDPLSASDYNIDARFMQAIWDQSYSALSTFNTIIRTYDGNTSYNNIVQICKIWRCWMMLRLTDYLGDIPYTQAANAEATNPVYDTQETIYKTMFTELADAASKLDASAANNIGNYDLVYGGDAKKWIKFANSLRLRMACRIADVDMATAKTQAAAAIAGGVFTSSDDDALLAMGDATTETSSQNPLYYHRNSGVIHMSTAYYRIVENLGGINWPTAADQAANSNITNDILSVPVGLHPAKVDPRAPIQFQPSGIVETVTTASLNHNWAGTDPGNISSAVGAKMETGQFVNDYANIGPFFTQNPARPWPCLRYDEVCFLRAIAIERGIVSGGSAKEYYEAGVKASMTQYGIPASVQTAYLASTTPNYYGTTANYSDNSGKCNTALDKILTQKWIADFVELSFESWSDHRQYNKPTLMPFAHVNESVFTMNATAKANNTPAAYIKRGYYPSTEESVNGTNLQDAIKRMGSNSIQNNVWWDTNK
jgi:hypothetical protein